MQEAKELTLSVLEDVSRRKFDAVPNTPARGAEGTAADLLVAGWLLVGCWLVADCWLLVRIKIVQISIHR